MSGPAPKKFEWTAGPLGPVKLARGEPSDQAEISAGKETSFGCEGYQDPADRFQTGGRAHRGCIAGRMPLRKIKIHQIDGRNPGVQERNVVVVYPWTGPGSEIPYPQLARFLPHHIHNIGCLFPGDSFPQEVQVLLPDHVHHEDKERPVVPARFHEAGGAWKEAGRVRLASD